MTEVNVDDTDTNSILYSGSWVEIGGGPAQEFNGTVHSTTETGATATIRFKGTRIVLKCTVPQGNGSMSMISFVDGKMDTQVMRQSRDNTAFYDDVWFDSNFTAGPHELVIQNTGGALDSPFQLDRFIVTGSVIPVSAQPGVPTTTTQSSTSSTSQGGTTSIPDSSSSPPSSIAGLVTVTESSTTFTLIIATDGSVQTLGVAPSTGSGSHSSRNTGAIVGGVLGGIACLLFLVLLLLRVRRHKSSLATQLLPQPKESEPNRSRGTPGIIPFILGDNSNIQPCTKAPPTANDSAATTTPGLSRNLTEVPVHPADPNQHTTNSSLNEKDSQLFRGTFAILNSSSSANINAIAGTNPEPPGHDQIHRNEGVIVSSPRRSFLSEDPITSNDLPPSYQSARDPA